MANFKTHVLIAATISGTASIAVMATEMGSNVEVGRYFILGVIGGLLPDIDSDNSLPTKIFFTILALFSGFWVVLRMLSDYSFVELCIVWSSVFLIIRYFMFEAFIRLTSHRGIFHSCLATVFFSLLTVNISHQLLGFSTFVSWLNGCFIGLGYFIHLCLDEVYSVDLLNNRIKKSFGTALKLVSIRSVKASILMTMLTLALYANSPEIKPAWIKVTATAKHYSIENRWFPKANQWFVGLPEKLMRFVDNCIISPSDNA